MHHDVDFIERLEAIRARFVLRTNAWVPEFIAMRDCLRCGRAAADLYADLLKRSHQIAGTAGTLGFVALGNAAAELRQALDRRSNMRTESERYAELASALEVFLKSVEELPNASDQIPSAKVQESFEEVSLPSILDATDSKAHILIADDDKLLRDILIEAFSAQGWEVTEASNGLEVIISLFKLSGAPSEERPDLIVLDVDMPSMDGFEALRLIQTSPAWREVPVIMLTARQDKADRIRGVFKGAQDYIAKPLDFFELLSRISELLAVKRGLATR